MKWDDFAGPTAAVGSTQNRPKRTRQPVQQYGMSSANSGATPDDAVDLDEEDETQGRAEAQDKAFATTAASRTTTSTRRRTKKVNFEDLSPGELLERLTHTDNERTWIHDELKDVKKKRTQDRKDKETEKDQRKKLQTEVGNLKQEIQSFRAHEKEARATIQQQQEDFTEAQKDWIAKVEAQSYPSLPDNIIRDKFWELLKSCRDWAKTWFRKDFRGAEPNSMEILFNICAREDLILRQQLWQRLHMEKTKSMRVLGFGYLAQGMLNAFFKDPFFAFETTLRAALDMLNKNHERGR